MAALLQFNDASYLTELDSLRWPLALCLRDACRCGTTVKRANVVTRAIGTNRAMRNGFVQSLGDQFPQHGDEPRMRSDSLRSHHCQPELVGSSAGFDVEVEKHLQVVRQEADRHDHHILRP